MRILKFSEESFQGTLGCRSFKGSKGILCFCSNCFGRTPSDLRFRFRYMLSLTMMHHGLKKLGG